MPVRTDPETRAPMSTHPPRVLVADDDAASRRFLGDGLRGLGAVVETRDDGPGALALARAEAFDLLLLDLHMPGGGASMLLSALREDAGAASTGSVAVATSAGLSTHDRRRLLAEGFVDALAKPCDLAALRRVLALVRDEATPVLDQAAGLKATGDADTLRALRGLLRDELLTLDRDLERGDLAAVALVDRLHRLRSACGFCGAHALAIQTARLQNVLREVPDHAGASMQRFRRALHDTLEALRAEKNTG